MFHRVAVPTVIVVVISSVVTTNGRSDEAPSSFEAQNGFLSQQEFADARQAFENVETPTTGLGIHFNESSCATCHVAPRAGLLPAGSGPITEVRAGFIARSGEFFPAPGGTLITTRAVGRATPEITAIVGGPERSGPVHHAVTVRGGFRGSGAGRGAAENRARPTKTQRRPHRRTRPRSSDLGGSRDDGSREVRLGSTAR